MCIIFPNRWPILFMEGYLKAYSLVFAYSVLILRVKFLLLLFFSAWWSFSHLHQAFKDTGILTQLTWNSGRPALSSQLSGYLNLENWKEGAPGSAQHIYTSFTYAYHPPDRKQDYYTECHWILLRCLSTYLSCISCGDTLQKRWIL